MKNAVIIKSFPNGLSIFLDSEMPFAQLLEEIAMKFRESANFFKDASMVLSFEGRELTDQEERQIAETISANSRLNIVCIMGKNEETNKTYVRALQQLSFHQEVLENAGQFYKGTLKDGQILETENSIIVLGDVYPGACVISSKDIVILGGLYGKAYAGGNGEEGHFVAALEMSPEKLRRFQIQNVGETEQMVNQTEDSTQNCFCERRQSDFRANYQRITKRPALLG